MARASPLRRAAQAFTAAAVAVTSKDTTKRDEASDWQRVALGYYDSVGEIRYAAEFYGILGGVDYFVATKDTDGQPVPVLDEASGVDAQTASDLTAVWDRVQDPGGGRAQLCSQYGRLRFLTGESYLTVTWEAEESEITGVRPELDECWEMLSVDELRVKRADKKVTRYRSDASAAKHDYTLLDPGDDPVPDSMMVWRLWKRHPRRSGNADSAMRAILDLCEELVLLRKAIRGRARSRIADAGILFLPEQMFLPGEQPADADDDPMQDPLMAAIIEAAIAPIKDEGTAASVIPAMIRADADMIEKARLLRFRDSNETYPEIQLRQDCVTAIARGLPLPAEVITGLADVNHWGQWFISDQTWKHLEPDAQALCREMTDAYFQPAIEQEGIVTDPASFFVWYDATPVIIRPDRGRDAKDLYDRWSLSSEALRNSTGFEEADAPDQTEIDQRVQIEQAIRVRESIQETSLPTVEASPDVTQAPPNEGEPVAASGEVHWLNGGFDVAVLRCKEIAGGRIRGALQSSDEATRYDGVPNHDLAAQMGQANVHRVLAKTNPEPELVRNGAVILRASLERQGMTPVAARVIADSVEREAVNCLYEPATLHQD